MIKFIKKHKLNFISYFLCAFAMALFTIISFSCKTYAYSIDQNGNLVGDNLISGMTHISTDRFNIAYQSNNSIEFQENVIYTFVCERNYNSSMISSYYLNERLFDMVSGYSRYFLTNTNEKYIAQFTASGNASTSDIIIKNERDNSNTYYTNDLYNFMILEGAYTLENVPNYEPYGIWYSKSNYDNLQEQYNGLYDSQITNNIKYAFNGAIAKLYDGTNSAPLDQQIPLVQGTMSVDSSYLVTSGDCLAISDYFDDIDYEVVDYPLYTYYIKPNIVINNSFLIQVSDLTFDYDFTLYYSDGTSQVYNASRLNPPRYTIVVNEDRKDVLFLTFDLYLPDYAYLEMQMTIDGVSYNTGYTMGYNDGYNWGNTNGYSNGYQNKVSSYENQINSLNNSIDTLKDLNSQLQEQITNNLGWSSLFFAFADTPFKVVSNVLGFELFGLNLFATFIGMITVFGVVYLLKKFI